MTSNTDKFRALFLAALMVVSVFGGAMAFAGSVGALTDEANLSAANVDVQDGVQDQTVVFDAQNATEFNAEDTGTPTVSFAAPSDLTFEDVSVSDLSIVAGSVDSSNISAAVDNDGNVTVTFNESALSADDFGASESLKVTLTVSVDAGDASIGTHTYTLYDSKASGISTVDFEVNDSEVREFDGTAIAGSLVYSGQSIAVDVTDEAQPEEVTLRQVTGEDSSTPVANNLVNDYDVVTFDTEGLETGDYYLAGGDLNQSNSEFEIVSQDLAVSFEDDEVDNDGATTNDLTIESDLRNDYDVTIYVDGFSEDDYNDVFSGVSDAGDAYENSDDEWVIDIENAEDDHTLDFDGIDADDYEFEVDVVDSDASATANVTVVDVGEGQLDLGQTTYEQNQGDIAEITVSFEEAASEGYLVIGDEEDVGYQANVSLTSGGEDDVTVAFNTYTAGNASDMEDVVWIADDESDAAIDYEEGTNQSTSGLSEDVLDLGDYQLSVMANAADGNDALENADNVGTLWIQERSLNGISTWTASTSVDLTDTDEVLSAMDEGTLTETDSFAQDDYVVHAIDVSGLNGLFETSNLSTLLENGEGIEDTDSLYLSIEQTDESTGPNADPATVNVSDLVDNSNVIVDEDNDSVYLVTDESTIVTEADGTLEDGDEFTTEFRVQDTRLLDYNADEDEVEDVRESVETTFSVNERDASFDTETIDGDDYVTVEAAEEQVISGSTNVAPGSEVRIRAMGEGDARFVKEATDLVVQSDGTFEGTFDFSDRAVDEEFTASLRGDISDVSADGIVVEAEEEVTTTEPTTTEPTTTEPTTTEPTTEETTEQTTEETTTEETTTTSQQTPGFGIAVAMLALIGAALIALRRRN